MRQLSFLVLALVVLALATTATGQPASTPSTGTVTISVEPFDPGQLVGAVIGSTRTAYGITNHPISAEIIDERDRVLADGNRIHDEYHGKLFRDSEGRVRVEGEVSIGMPPWTRISIHDPVQKVDIEFDTRSKSAIIHHYERTRPGETAPVPAKPGPDPAHASAQKPAFDGGMPSSPPSDPLHPATARSDAVAVWANISYSRPEAIGPAEIQGFNAIGKRRIWTTAPGATGNDETIMGTVESWYSPDLEVLLLAKSKSAMESSRHKLVNIQTGDPDPLLFQAPPGYTVKEEWPPR